jgi:6-phosphogluconolactonase
MKSCRANFTMRGGDQSCKSTGKQHDMRSIFSQLKSITRLSLGFLMVGVFMTTAQAETLRVYVGTYTNGTKSQGIYRFDLNTETGATTEPAVAAKVANPSFLAIHKNGKNLYSVNEIDDQNGKKSGGLTAFEIQANGDLKQINQVETGGTAPCHLSIDPTGRYVLFANYGGGSSGSVSINEDGSLGKLTAFVQHKGMSEDPNRQQGPHAHSVNFAPSGKFAYVADLGLDKVLIFAFDPQTGAMTPANPPHAAIKPKSGPRHFAFAPGGKRAFVINEMGNTVVAFDVNAETGELKETQTIGTLPADFKGTSYTAEVVVHPTGHFVYGSNRGYHSITTFAVEPGGALKYVGNYMSKAIDTPRNFNVDPSGKWMLIEGQNTGLIELHGINPKTGEPAGKPTATINVPTPVCVKFLAVK